MGHADIRLAAAASRATDIEDLLIWTYRHQRADRVIGTGAGPHAQEAALDGIERHASSADGIAAIERIGILGVRVDTSAPSAGALHIDAELTHEAVLRLDRPIALLVIRHATAADRPDDVRPVRARPRPALNGRGQPRILYDEWDRNRNYGACALDWSVALDPLPVARVEYALWRRALCEVAAALDRAGRLTRHRAAPPAAPPVPRFDQK